MLPQGEAPDVEVSDVADGAGVAPRDDQTARLEQALITEFLERRGLTRATLHDLPDADVHALMREASAYASARLAEVEARARYVQELHHNE